jgi:hypothetical protein
MKILRSAMAALAFTSTLSHGQTPPYDRSRPAVDIVALLNLDTRRASVVEAILENSVQRMNTAREQVGEATDETSHTVMRAAMHAIRADTDKQLSSVLTDEEMAKLKEAMRPQPPGDSSRKRGTPM